MVFTEFLKLHKWAPEDLVDLTQINANTQKLDEAVGSLQFFAFGTYTGNGQSGEEHPRRLVLARQPRLLLIIGGNATGLLAPAEERGIVRSGTAMSYVEVQYSEADHAITWYGASPQIQLNSNGSAYGYVALG